MRAACAAMLLSVRPRKTALTPSTKTQMTSELARQIQDLNARYVAAIDDDKLEAWPDFFSADGRYRVTTAENFERGLPLAMIYATSRAMLRDRVRSLREANVYEAQRYRHVIGPPLYRRDRAVRDRPLPRPPGRRGRRGALRREARDPRQPPDRHPARDSAVGWVERSETQHAADACAERCWVSQELDPTYGLRRHARPCAGHPRL